MEIKLAGLGKWLEGMSARHSPSMGAYYKSRDEMQCNVVKAKALYDTLSSTPATPCSHKSNSPSHIPHP